MNTKKKKYNLLIVIRLVLALIIWTIFFFPAFFIPRMWQYKTFWRIFIWLFLTAVKIRPHYLSKNIDLSNCEPVILAPNHKSFVDTYIVLKFLKRPFSIVHKKEMVKWNFFYKLMFWKMGLVPVDRGEYSSQKEAIEKIKKLIKKNYSIVMFPEGFYHFDKPVGPLKRGIAKIAKDTGIGVIPMAIYGITNDFLFDKEFKWRDVYLKAGNILKYSDYNSDTLFLEALRCKIEDLYNEIKLEINKCT